MCVIEARSQLTGSCGFARIDVADNDHVDVHLFLTAERRTVSQKPIKICDNIVMIVVDVRWMADAHVDSPHGCGIVLLTVWCGFCLFFGKKVNLMMKNVSDDILDE
jgi:hypothetical protein